jgi:hypothetical protein
MELGRNAGPGVPDLDARVMFAAPAGDENAAVLRVPHGIADQVEEDAMQQCRIGHQPAVRDAHAQAQIFRGGGFGEALDDLADGLRGCTGGLDQSWPSSRE